jgi:hypothetical protein
MGFQPQCTLRNHWYGQDFILWEKPVPAMAVVREDEDHAEIGRTSLVRSFPSRARATLAAKTA